MNLAGDRICIYAVCNNLPVRLLNLTVGGQNGRILYVCKEKICWLGLLQIFPVVSLLIHHCLSAKRYTSCTMSAFKIQGSWLVLLANSFQSELKYIIHFVNTRYKIEKIIHWHNIDAMNIAVLSYTIIDKWVRDILNIPRAERSGSLVLCDDIKTLGFFAKLIRH